MKIKSYQDLLNIKNNKSEEMSAKLCKNTGSDVTYFAVCCSSSCDNEKKTELLQEFINQISLLGYKKVAKAYFTGCFGICSKGPIVAVYPQGIIYGSVQKEDVKNIVLAHLKDKSVYDKKLITVDNKKVKTTSEIPFLSRQKQIVNKLGGIINPCDISDYIATDGYFALQKALNKMSSQQIINEVLASGLRGRGGAGFLTGQKWQYAADEKLNEKYIICNGDEGDPGAFMDRSIFEHDPHSIIEAMIIAGKAIGANRGIVYIRLEYELATKIIKKAILDARSAGLLGKNILGSDFDFDIAIKPGAGAFVCGEETALIASAEGKRGEPTLKPPYPAKVGYNACPTVINNVETLANIAKIILNGAEEFAKIGTAQSKGTKIFALSGKIKNTGLVELEIGSTLAEIVENIGGGTPDGTPFKAVMLGGPSGGCLSYSQKDVALDYENLKQYGTMMGSGGMIVMDHSTCMCDIARFFMEFSCDESCGKCTPCREGNRQMLEILTRICEGKGKLEDLDELENIAYYVKNNSLCGLGQSSPNPVLSTLNNFREEYIAHINGKCPAGVCKNLVSFTIEPQKCTGCSLCSRVCPVKAISGEVLKPPFVIDKQKCIKCGKCYNTCKFRAIKKD